MGIGIFPVYVVDVVRAYEWYVKFLCELYEKGICPLLLLKTVILQFDVVSVAEQVLEPCGSFLRLVIAVMEKVLKYLAAKTCRKADEVLAVGSENFIIYSGFVVEAFSICDGRELHQVMIASVIHRKQDEMIEMVASFRCRTLVPPVFRIHVEFAADDGLYTGSLAGFVEFQRTVHVAVVRDGYGIHVVFLALRNVFSYLGGTVQKGIVGMVVQMDESASLCFCFLIDDLFTHKVKYNGKRLVCLTSARLNWIGSRVNHDRRKKNE